VLFTTQILRDGRLKITATKELQAICQTALDTDKANDNSIEEMRTEQDIIQCIRESEGYDYCRPEDVGALTDAPMMCDDAENPTKVWAFMSYAVTSVTECLAERGYCIWEFSEVEHLKGA
jgi:hypothetical protein